MGRLLNRREFTALAAASLAGGRAARAAAPTEGQAMDRPNVLWLIAEDMCPDLGCYGQALNHTPHLDRLAAEGIRFTHAYSAAPVCSTSRSALQTGMYPITIGVHHHRSHRSDGYRLPEGVRLFSEVFREHGYFTCNATYRGRGRFRPGKTDFNFSCDQPFDGIEWRERAPGQPFFAQVNFNEAHRGGTWDEVRKRENRLDPARVALPPYYPDDPVVRENVATYLEVISQLDVKVGEVLGRLEEDGLTENTLVFFLGDHGRCLIRGKQWLYDAGIHVPLIVRRPGRLDAGTVCDDLASLIDVGPSALRWADIVLPERCEGRPLLDPKTPPRTCVFAARDRCDETRDRIRCVRTQRYKYIRNFMPERPYTQSNRYIESHYPTLAILKRRHAEGTLTPAQALFMQPRKPGEELYDLETDPHEVCNLAESSAHKGVLDELRGTLGAWLEDTGDLGALPEDAAAIFHEPKARR